MKYSWRVGAMVGALIYIIIAAVILIKLPMTEEQSVQGWTNLIMFTIAVVLYTVLFSILGVRYVLALALVSGLARFVPYIGQWINWAVLLLVLLFQKYNYFGLSSIHYLILVVAIVFVVDQVLDNFVSPRIMGRSIGVHPAAVVLAAMIGFSLLGIVGVIVAAPGLASITMLGKYISRKMLDLDPWPESEEPDVGTGFAWSTIARLLSTLYDKIKTRFQMRK